jgi:hypothetical protein
MLRGQREHLAFRSFCEQVILAKELAERVRVPQHHPSRVPHRRASVCSRRSAAAPPPPQDAIGVVTPKEFLDLLELARRPVVCGVRRRGPSWLPNRQKGLPRIPGSRQRSAPAVFRKRLRDTLAKRRDGHCGVLAGLSPTLGFPRGFPYIKKSIGSNPTQISLIVRDFG